MNHLNSQLGVNINKQGAEWVLESKAMTKVKTVFENDVFDDMRLT